MIPSVYSPVPLLSFDHQVWHLFGWIEIMQSHWSSYDCWLWKDGDQTYDLLMGGQNLISFLSGALVTESDVALG